MSATKEKHTPGPWRAVLYKPSKDVWGSAEGGHLADIIPTFDGLDQAKANASLIAAAPELLDAAESTLEWLQILKSQGELKHGSHIRLLESAIRKARGEE